MTLNDLPALNATLNAISAALLLTGYILIRRGDRVLHKRFMLAALAASALFLTSYLVYHTYAGVGRRFAGEGAVRYVYLTILLTHVVLAIVILPMVLITTFRGLRSDFGRHVRIARWTFPLWAYVSVTGVLVYLMLYQWD